MPLMLLLGPHSLIGGIDHAWSLHALDLSYHSGTLNRLSLSFLESKLALVTTALAPASATGNSTSLMLLGCCPFFMGKSQTGHPCNTGKYVIGLQPGLKGVETHPKGKPEAEAWCMSQASNLYLVVRQGERKASAAHARLGPICRKRVGDKQSTIMEA